MFKYFKYPILAIISFLFICSFLFGVGRFKSKIAQGQEWLNVPGMNFMVRANHPRIFLTPERLAVLKNQAVAGDAYWVQLKKACDSALTKIPANLETISYVEPLALCYKVTDNSQYALKAIEFMNNYLEWLNVNFDFESPITSYPRSNSTILAETDWGNWHMVSISIGFDWVYNQLTEENKNFIVSVANKCIDSAMVRKGYSYCADPVNCADPVSNHAHTKMRTEAFIGIATYGDNLRASEYIKNSYDFFVNKMMPLYQKYNKGGQIYMGTNYGYGRTLPFALFFVEAVRTAFSIDFYAQNSWLKDIVYYLIYAQHPVEGTYVFGTRALGAEMGFGDRLEHVQSLYFLRSYYSDEMTERYIESFMNERKINTIDTRTDTYNAQRIAYQFLLRNKNVLPIDYRTNLPPAYLSEGLGMFLARSDWSEKALWVSLQGGDYVGDHQGFDTGQFTIFRGKRLVSNAGINRVQIGRYGVRQDLYYLALQGFSPTGSNVESFENKENFAYVKIDLTRSYYGPEFKGQIVRGKVLNQEVSKTIRQVILFRPDYILLYDKTGTVSEAISTKWYASFDTPNIFIDNNTFYFSRENNKLYIKTLLPYSVNVTSTLLGVYNQKSFTSIEVSPQTPIKNEKYLHLFYAPQEANSLMVEASSIGSLTNNMIGVQINDSAGQIIAMFSQNEEKDSGGLQEPVIYNISGQGNSKHLLVDLKPNIVFTIIKTNLGTGEVVQTQNKTSSSQGTLYFETSLGFNQQITIVPAGTQPSQLLPNITLIKSVNKTQAASQEELIYTITYQNNGQGLANNVLITDAIPNGTIYIPNSATANPTFTNNTLIWAIPSLPAGSRGTISFRVRVE